MELVKIAQAADALFEAKQELGGLLADEQDAKFNLEAAEMTALATGQVQGKNEAERKAALYELTKPLRTHLAIVQRAVTTARYWHDALALRWRQIELELRAEELTGVQTWQNKEEDHHEPA